MVQKFITGATGYLPLLRFDRAVARTELSWASLGGTGRGVRATAGWDEDALTQAVEAARSLALDGPAPAAVTFASTSAPFLDRSQAGILAEALALPRTAHTMDTAGCRRAATSALLRALQGGGTGVELIAAGERRVTQPGSAQSMNWGDGGSAVRVGDGPGVARLLGAACVAHDLLDTVTSAEGGLPYAAEDRFVRDIAVADVLLPAVRAACTDAGVAPGDITWAVVPEPVSGTYRVVAKAAGLGAPNLCEEVAARAGDLGAAMPLFGLALALERAQPGDRILLVGFGNGADALILEVTAALLTRSAHYALAEGAVLRGWTRFLSLTGGVSLNWGPRAEVNQKVSASVLARHGRDMHGFIGGRDPRGNVQFPKTPIPVSPEATGPEPYEDVRLSDAPARLASITADRLNFTPDPPFVFGLVQFDNGARVAMELCDTDGMVPEVGNALRMRFRVKAIDRQRNFRSYFWKAAPLTRPALTQEAK
jgi:hydroxymethylglutaryl-CoA synthase